MPPKIYYYEPKIFGFKIAGKRGSKFFDPPHGNIKMIEDSMQALEVESIQKGMSRVELNAAPQDKKDASSK